MLFGVAAPGIFKLFTMESLRNMASDGRSRCLKSILKTHSFLDPDTQKKIRKVSFAPEMDVLVFSKEQTIVSRVPSPLQDLVSGLGRLSLQSLSPSSHRRGVWLGEGLESWRALNKTSNVRTRRGPVTRSRRRDSF